MRALLMRILKIIGAGFGLLVLLVGALVLRLWWATLTPKVPKGWPAGSVWVEGPPEFGDLSPRGEFVGCWLDAERHVDRCQFAQYTGGITHVGDYTTCDGHAPLPDAELTVRPADYTKGTFDESTVDQVRLASGAVLIAASACAARKREAGHLGLPPSSP